MPSADSSHPDPNLLAPPAHPRNFLVSPPGSPPEGWEPIVEDAPNEQTLADDLVKALQSIQIDDTGNTLAHRRWIGDGDGDVDMHDRDKGNVILETNDGMIFAVQAPVEDEKKDHQPIFMEQVEYVGRGGAEGSSAGWRTPGLEERTYSGRPTPTARPPVPGQL